MRKNYEKYTCGNCNWRDYGTNTHYVCKEGDKDNWFGVTRTERACPKFRKKQKTIKNKEKRDSN